MKKLRSSSIAFHCTASPLSVRLVLCDDVALCVLDCILKSLRVRFFVSQNPKRKSYSSIEKLFFMFNSNRLVPPASKMALTTTLQASVWAPRVKYTSRGSCLRRQLLEQLQTTFVPDGGTPLYTSIAKKRMSLDRVNKPFDVLYSNNTLEIGTFCCLFSRASVLLLHKCLLPKAGI